MTASEIFARMLYEVRGMTASKVHAVIEKYPTVAHLCSAYEALQSERERGSMISGMAYLDKDGVEKRIRNHESELTYLVFGSTAYGKRRESGGMN